MAQTQIPSPSVEPSSPPAPVEPSAPSGGFFQNLVDLYFAPRQAFTRIVGRPAVLLPLLGYFVLVLGFTVIWMNKMEPRVFMKTQLEEQGRWDKIPADQREEVLDRASGQMKYFAWIPAIVGTPLILAVTAAVLMFIYRFFYSAEVGFKQSFGIVTWTFFAVGLVTTPLMLLVLKLKDDWNLNPQEALQANLGLLVDKATTAKPLWALLTSFDLFSLWLVFLLAAGFGVASRKTTGSALWGILVPWAVIVLVKVGFSALM